MKHNTLCKMINLSMTLEKSCKITGCLFICSIFLVVFILNFIKGPQFSPDSGSYENYSIIRIGMYPFTISFFKFLFNEQAFKYLAAFQTLLTLSAIYYLARFLKLQFNLPFFSYIAIIFVFLFPIVSHSFASNITSESLAYPLFLLVVLSFFKMAISQKNINYLLFVTILFLLCFTRQQYICLYVVAFLYAFYILIFEKNWKNSRKVLLTSTLSLCTFFIAERAYHLTYHGHFAGTPFVGTQLLMRPLFVASPNALQSISDPKQKLFITEVVEELKKMDIIDPGAPSKELYAYEYFYNTMYHQVSSAIWSKVWSKEVLDKELNQDLTNFQVLQIIDHNALIMSMKLLQTNFVATVIYYIKDVLRGMGGYTSVFFIFIISLAFVVSAYGSKKINLLYLLAICSIVMHLGNSALVCLFEPPLTRYIYTTNAVMCVMLIIFLTDLLPYLSMQNKKLCAE